MTAANAAANALLTHGIEFPTASVADVWVEPLSPGAFEPYILVQVFEDGSCLDSSGMPWDDWHDLFLELQGDWVREIKITVVRHKVEGQAALVASAFSRMEAGAYDEVAPWM